MVNKKFKSTGVQSGKEYITTQKEKFNCNIIWYIMNGELGGKM